MEKKAKPKGVLELPIDGAAVSGFRERHGLSKAEACGLLGIPSLSKFAATIAQGPEELDLSLALLVRYFYEHPDMVPKKRPMKVIDAYNMFESVLGDKINEVTFASLMGRTGGSGYRWIRQEGRVTPFVTRILDRFTEMREAGISDKDIVEGWVEIVRTECANRGIEFRLERERKRKRRTTKTVPKG